MAIGEYPHVEAEWPSSAIPLLSMAMIGATVTCRLETLFLILDGRHRSDHRDGAGDIQKIEADESELADEAEDSAEGGTCDGVVSSLGDLSTKGVRCVGELSHSALEYAHSFCLGSTRRCL